MKACTKCGKTKPLDEFYRAKAHKDGLMYECKACTKECRAKHYLANKDRLMAVSRAWATSNPERAREYARRYYRKYREKRIEVCKEYGKLNPEKVRAQNAVNHAIRDGRMVRPDRCQRCGKLCKPHAHHPDYSRPLEVEWLCPPCHKLHHADLERRAA